MQQTKIKCPIKFTFRKERKRSIEKEREEELRRGRGRWVTDGDAHVEPPETQQYIHHWGRGGGLFMLTLPLSG